MKFLLANPELDQQISQIKRLIRLSMDGVISDSMKSHGILYKKNYGVSITRLREIAKSLDKNHDLAQRLWLLDIRETLILATLLQPIETFSRELANTWMERCNNIELIEQASLNLFQHLAYAPEFSINCIKSANIHQKTFGFMLALRVYQRLSLTEIAEILGGALQTDISDNQPMLYNTLAVCLARLSRKDEATARLITEKIGHFSTDASTGRNHIYQTVKQELIFLRYIDENL